MKRFFLLLSFLVFIFTSISCRKKEIVTISDVDKKDVIVSKFAKNYPTFNYKRFREIFQNQIKNDSTLHFLYLEDECKPIWMQDTLDVHKLRELAFILKKSNTHGLSPNIFNYQKIATIINTIDAGYHTNNMDSLYYKISDLEATSSKALVKYITGMSFGFLDPKVLYKKDYDIKLLLPDSVFYSDLSKKIKKNPIAAIINSHPRDSVYLKLQEEYKYLDSIRNVKFDKINNSLTYKIGDKNVNILNIAKRLRITKEFKPDVLKPDSAFQRLDKNLLAAVNAFRRKNSYPEEATIGKITIDALNRPFDYYQNKIRANMERYRWKKVKKNNIKHIEVNVASATLAASHPDSLPLLMKICVGAVGHKTPLLQSDISYLNLNPTWNVPSSIAKNEVFVRQKKDPSYIPRNNMRLYKGGQEVNPSTVDWSTGDQSFYVRQSPGAGNSLGLIKFMFNNNFAVYLHDTPSKSAFNRKNRAVSHGCIRLHQPFDLAFFCLSPVSDLYKDQLLYSVNKSPISEEGKKLHKDSKLVKVTNILNPKDKISLSIDYLTAYMNPSDETLYYADDIYSYDTIILKELEALHKK